MPRARFPAPPPLAAAALHAPAMNPYPHAASIDSPTQLNGLIDLALDLRWSWSDTSDVLWRTIDPQLWDKTANPWLILQTVSTQRLRELATDADFIAELNRQLGVRAQSLSGPIWFDTVADRADLQRVAYFSMEFGLSDALPIYSGGLGILAGDTLKTASDLGGPVATRLPVPHMNILNGGVHAHRQGADFQESMIAPFGASTFCEAVQWGAQIDHALQSILQTKGLSVGVGDEGGFAPQVKSNEQPLELIAHAIEQAGLRPGTDVATAIDRASSEFFSNGHDQLRSKGRRLDAAEIVDHYTRLVQAHPIVPLKDSMAEGDWAGWKQLTAALGARIELVGDDIFCTKPTIIACGIAENIANVALIKLNQIGTLTETIVATRLARGERVEKYNQLMRKEQELGSVAHYAGRRGYVRAPRDCAPSTTHRPTP